MKNVYMTVLLCAAGLVVTNVAFATTATREQWGNSVKSYPARRTDGFDFKFTNVPSKIGYQVVSANVFATEMLSFYDEDGERRALACDEIPHNVYDYIDGATVCNSDNYVAISGLAQTDEYDGISFWMDTANILGKENYVWWCGAESALTGVDEWFPKKEIMPCAQDPYQAFKDKANARSYLYDASVSRNTLYQAIVDPGDTVCLTYACAPDYFPNLNVTSANASQLKCIGTVDACKIYDGDDERSEYLNLVKTERCNDSKYWIGPSTDMSKQNATHGTVYIKTLKEYMNQELARNKDSATYLHDKRPNNGVFTCNDLECKLTDDVLKVENTNCEYLCTTNGFAVRLSQPESDNPCPTYFKQQYDATKQMYVCKFDMDAVNNQRRADEDAERDAQEATQNAAAQQRAGCASAFCSASGGTYLYSSGSCACSGEPCDDTYSYAGHAYKYCTTNGLRKRCVGGLWQSTGTIPTDQDINRWKSALRSCVGAATSTMAAGDTISTLAGRLALVEDQFGLSKWRTADGKFNTARLASDLTAGVVLGTTGALVTSSVVKKKQVKDGFESLECTVGGQHVGDWGDVFHIDGK